MSQVSRRNPPGKLNLLAHLGSSSRLSAFLRFFIPLPRLFRIHNLDDRVRCVSYELYVVGCTIDRAEEGPERSEGTEGSGFGVSEADGSEGDVVIDQPFACGGRRGAGGQGLACQ